MASFCLEGLSLKEKQAILRREGFGQGKIKVEGHHQPFHASAVDLWGANTVVRGQQMSDVRPGVDLFWSAICRGKHRTNGKEE